LIAYFYILKFYFLSSNKNKIGVVYSTNPDFEYTLDLPTEVVTLDPAKQMLRVFLDTKNRGGKKTTVVERFVGAFDDLEDLSKKLKNKLGIGGSAKDGLILLQGDVVQKAKDILVSLNYKVK
jgi:translation initiation factor 1